MAKRGAPAGNQNARKHGFYSLTKADNLELEKAGEIEGLDNEIALLRVKIKDLIEADPENMELLLRASGTLARLVRTRYQITPEQKATLKDAIRKVLTDIAIPLGIKAVGG